MIRSKKAIPMRFPTALFFAFLSPECLMMLKRLLDLSIVESSNNFLSVIFYSLQEYFFKGMLADEIFDLSVCDYAALFDDGDLVTKFLGHIKDMG